jgi:hypothetical protein
MNDTALPEGDTPSDSVEALTRFYERTLAGYVRKARCWLRRHRIDENTLSAEGAVQAAWLRILERLQRTPGPRVPAPADLQREIPIVLWNVIVDARRSQSASKRTCKGERKIQGLDSTWDVVDRHGTRPDEELIARVVDIGVDQILVPVLFLSRYWCQADIAVSSIFEGKNELTPISR